jgi:hypothetical protein
MGLFENLGRRVEKFKQAAEDAASEDASHKCVDCGELYFRAYEECEACGGGPVVEIGTTDGQADDDGVAASENTASGTEPATSEETDTDDSEADDEPPTDEESESPDASEG